MMGQFRKIDPPYLDYLNESYDYYSIMHYDSKAFSKNGDDTIEAPSDALTRVIGKAMRMSEKDVRKNVGTGSMTALSLLAIVDGSPFVTSWTSTAAKLAKCAKCDHALANLPLRQ
ncbi:hypothetical protein D918_03341 [Trichuris suis]|nr:hypothetical protein D918_03341 [Trichuris suis]